jgi:hypothetical protein
MDRYPQQTPGHGLKNQPVKLLVQRSNWWLTQFDAGKKMYIDFQVKRKN